MKTGRGVIQTLLGIFNAVCFAVMAVLVVRDVRKQFLSHDSRAHGWFYAAIRREDHQCN